MRGSPPKSTWKTADMRTKKLLDDNLAKSIYLFPDNQSSRGTATTGKPVANPIQTSKPRATIHNSGKFR